MGGLGNQLFQIYNLIAYAYRHNFDFYIPTNIIGGRKTTYRDTLFKFLEKYRKNIKMKKLQEKGFHYTLLEKHDNVNLFGYFQDSIDLDSLEIMRGVFHHFMRRNNQIYLHIRGTDSDWALMYSKYYNLVVNHHFVKGNEIVLATDDLKRAKDVLKDSCKYVQSKSSNAFDDFIYMLGAKYLIISPSTFSLWALLLNDECEFAIAPDIFRKYFTFSRDNLTIEFLG